MRTTLLVLSVFVFSLACGGAGSSGGGGGGTPAISADPASVDIENTRWTFYDLAGGSESTVWFFEGGKYLDFDYDDACRSCSWTKSGKFIEMNDGDTVWKGVLVGNHTVAGETEADGGEWRWRMIRHPPSAEYACDPGSGFDLTGTRWKYHQLDDDFTATTIFLPGGKMWDSDAGWDAGAKWTATGTDVSFSTGAGSTWNGVLHGHTMITQKGKSPPNWVMAREASSAEQACAPDNMDLSGSRWVYTELDGDYESVMYLMPGGVFYEPAEGTKGTWERSGATLEMQLGSNSYSGRLVGTHTAVGTDGSPAWWRMTRQAGSAEMTKSR